jgi:hypothetical protein
MKSIRGMTPASIIELLHDFRFGSRPCENAAPHSETALDHQRGDFSGYFCCSASRVKLIRCLSCGVRSTSRYNCRSVHGLDWFSDRFRFQKPWRRHSKIGVTHRLACATGLHSRAEGERHLGRHCAGLSPLTGRAGIPSKRPSKRNGIQQALGGRAARTGFHIGVRCCLSKWLAEIIFKFAAVPEPSPAHFSTP